MDQAVRNKLRNAVTQCRKLLEDATVQALQGRFGIYAVHKKGEVQVDDESRMGHLTDEDRSCRQNLLDHLEHIKAIGYSPRDALNQLIREIAFTHLNRLCAYKMMEARGLIREAVSRGLKSQGFFFYLADHPEDEKLHKGGHQDAAYRNYLDWLGGTLSQEIGVLFNPNDPANRLYPPQRLIDEVLRLINSDELLEIWAQDETIGWVYQYFTPKELRDQARKESQAPRNSYELAFRNQFFTPRYVVEFLTDNTLGRTWYEMRKGKTSLKEHCRYLVRRPTEIFLAKGEEPPAEATEPRDDLTQEELLKQSVYIPHRPKKDPREIKILDPACGSGHFLLYCFDLLQVIYEEAYDDPDLAMALRKDYPSLEDLWRAVPGLILKVNLHGIDIDLRSTQIAALALWLRCQRAYQELGLKNGQQPKITRSNIVCAEPMPGEADLLKEFTATLQPKVLGQLVEVVFEKMKLAGEAGSLLKIEEEIREAATKAKKEYQEELRWRKEQAGYLPGMAPPREMTLFDFSDITDSEFLDQTEEKIVAALHKYAEHAANGLSFRRKLFAGDAERGFAFIDLCRRRFDVVLMNPPFGDPTDATRAHFKLAYPTAADNNAVCFLMRGEELLRPSGFAGSITDCSWAKKYDYRDFRGHILDSENLRILVHLGWGVLDTANVETNISVRGGHCALAFTLNTANIQKKDEALISAVNDNSTESFCKYLRFRKLPNYVFAFEMRNDEFSAYADLDLVTTFMRAVAGVKSCNASADFRAWWEVPQNKIGELFDWQLLHNGSPYCPFHYPAFFAVRYDKGLWTQLMANGGARPGEEYYSKAGVAFGKRTDKMYGYVKPPGQVFSQEGQAIFPVGQTSIWAALALINSDVYSKHANYVAGQHKYHNYLNKICLRVKKLPNESIDAEEVHLLLRSLDVANETTYLFYHPGTRPEFQFSRNQESRDSESSNLLAAVKTIRYKINRIICKALGSDSNGSDVTEVDYYSHYFGESFCANLFATSWLSFAVGCTIGRWDIRFATGLRQPPALPDPFDPLPICPPGMLQGADGHPALPGEVQRDYPIRIEWDGILVDDLEHKSDIVRRVCEVLEAIYKDQAEVFEQEVCDILGVRELRDYFCKPGNGGFWMDHIRRYTKSRRKAPIYWYLRSAKGNYGLWVYYHRLDKDLLFKALLNYVEPKIRLEEDRLNTLRAKKDAAGSSGREAKQLERDLDRQDQLVSELHDFKDKLRRAADLQLTPDLNDGVVLNIAPLWELVPWKEAKNYWDDLIEGKYEWSSIGKQLREKGFVE